VDASGHSDLSHHWCKPSDKYLYDDSTPCVFIPFPKRLWPLTLLLETATTTTTTTTTATATAITTR